jgi:hypothetical protein
MVVGHLQLALGDMAVSFFPVCMLLDHCWTKRQTTGFIKSLIYMRTGQAGDFVIEATHWHYFRVRHCQ